MENDVLSHLLQIAEKLPEPQNLFSGKRLKEHFKLPDNILIFFHNFFAPVPNSHGRCTLVFPFDPMIYYVNSQRIDMSPGSVLFVPPYAVRFLHPGSQGARRFFITFDDPGKQSYLPEAGSSKITTDAWETLQRFLLLYREGDPGKSDLLSVELMIFLKKFRKNPLLDTDTRHQLSEAVEKTIEFIESHLDSPVTLKDIAKAASLSESHLRFLFRKEMNISLGRFLATKRLDAAKYRLLQSDLTLGEIAASCGFNNVYVFSTFFKKNTGISPIRFRKSHLNE